MYWEAAGGAVGAVAFGRLTGLIVGHVGRRRRDLLGMDMMARYAAWLLDQRLRFAPRTRRSAEIRAVVEARRAGSQEADVLSDYAAERQGVLVDTSIGVMAGGIVLAALADWLGVEALRLAVIVGFVVISLAHAVFIVRLARSK